MPETPVNNYDHEDEQEHGNRHPSGGPGLSGSRIPGEATPEIDSGNRDKAESAAHELRDAVFTKASPAESREQPESGPESVSFWEKLKHSALYGNKQKAAAAAAAKSDRSSRRQNKTALLVGGILAVFVAGVWLFSIVSAPVRKPPAQAAASAQPKAPETAKSLTPGLEAHPNQQQHADSRPVTAADIRATANGAPRPPVSTRKSSDADHEGDYALGKIPSPSPPAPAPSAPPQPVAPKKNPLDTTSLVFVRHSPAESAAKSAGSAEPVSFEPALALKSQPFDSLPTGTRLVARLETPVSTAVTLPVVAIVEYNYEDRDHRLLIPAGSRVFGSLEQADSQGFVGLHFQSIQRPADPAPIPFEARAIGLDYQPLKGVVTGRHRGRRFLVRAASGIGEMTAATLGMNRGAGAGDALNNNILIREQLMNNIGSAGDQEVQQLAYTEHAVVTLSGNTRFYLIVDRTGRQSKRYGNRNRQGVEANATKAGVEAQLLELRKELADITAKQTPLASQSTAVPASDTTGAAAPATAMHQPQ